jgi:hypothetical protein
MSNPAKPTDPRVSGPISSNVTSANQESNQLPPMNELVTDKPIQAVSPELSLWRWLTEPHVEQWLLPATGAWVLGLDWLLFTQETITLGLAVPRTAVTGFGGGAIGT